MLKTLSHISCIIFVLSLTLESSVADEINYGTRIPSTLELIRHFKSEDDSNGKAYRTIVINKNSSGDKPENSELESQSSKNSVSLQIQFDFDSYSLTDRAVQQLYPLGSALESKELEDLNFVLEGHTDAVGSDQYNLVLSERRANAVKQHLLSNFEISSNKIGTKGLGESSLLIPDKPDAAENRRVRFTAQ